jgi:hypothetical protein
LIFADARAIPSRCGPSPVALSHTRHDPMPYPGEPFRLRGGVHARRRDPLHLIRVIPA